MRGAGMSTNSAGTPSSLNYNRHGMGGQGNQGTGVAYSPHSLYTPTGQSDVYSASMSMDAFPSSPYITIDSLFHSPNIRNAISSLYSTVPKRSVMTVTSSKFSQFTAIYKLEEVPKPSMMLPHVKMQVFQTGSRFSDKEILLRRITNQSSTKAMDCTAVIDQFRHYRHPNLVSLMNVYHTNEFVMGENDIIMEYRYISGAKSLWEAFVKGGRATEGLLWSFTCQMASLLRSFHETLVPLRGLHWSKIVYLEQTGRFYYTGLGMMNLLDPMPLDGIPADPMQMEGLPPILFTLMQKDIESLGVVLMQLATQNVDFRAEHFDYAHPVPGFSSVFSDLVSTCLRCVEMRVTIAPLCQALGERMSMEVGHHEGHADYLLSQCSKELHNGRLMRLMMKLNFVIEGSDEYAGDHRYALRLFNQFLFNQVDDQNRVQLDWGHAYHCLNKLDCGSSELIQLMNVEQTEVMVVSYADLRNFLETSFERLQQLSRTGGEDLGFIPSPAAA